MDPKQQPIPPQTPQPQLPNQPQPTPMSQPVQQKPQFPAQPQFGAQNPMNSVAPKNNKKLYIIIGAVAAVLIIGGTVTMFLMKNDDKTTPAAKINASSNENDKLGYSDTSIDAKKSRDIDRKTKLNMMDTSLEIYYNNKYGYPSVKDLSNENWIKGNLENLKPIQLDQFKDPTGRMLGSAGSDFIYTLDNSTESSAKDCTSPTDSNGKDVFGNTPCEHFSLTAKMESQPTFTKNSLN